LAIGICTTTRESAAAPHPHLVLHQTAARLENTRTPSGWQLAFLSPQPADASPPDAHALPWAACGSREGGEGRRGLRRAWQANRSL